MLWMSAFREYHPTLHSCLKSDSTLQFVTRFQVKTVFMIYYTFWLTLNYILKLNISQFILNKIMLTFWYNFIIMPETLIPYWLLKYHISYSYNVLAFLLPYELLLCCIGYSNTVLAI